MTFRGFGGKHYRDYLSSYRSDADGSGLQPLPSKSSLDGLFKGHRAQRPISCADDVHQAALDPQSTLIIEATDITGAMPAGVARGVSLGEDASVISGFRVTGAQGYFPKYTCIRSQFSRRNTERIQRRDRYFDPRERKAY